MSKTVDRSRRRIPWVLVLTLAVLAVALPSAADEPSARGIDRVCPAPATQEPTGADADADGTVASFPDLGTTHGEAIVCAAGYGIVSGFVDGTFRPDRPITRGQMATFVAQWLRTATGIPLTVPADPGFSDIEGNVHAPAIAALGAIDVVGGRSDGTFGPQNTLTRGQFTRAVANAISYADVFAVGGPLPPADERVVFTDVAGTTFESSIQALAGVGIALGTSDGGFRPRAAVTRGQLATFLMRAADYLDRYQRWEPTAQIGRLIADLEFVPAPEPAAAGTTQRSTVILRIDAFDGTLRYTLELFDAPGPYVDPGASIHLGDPTVGGPLVLHLADAATLGAVTDGATTGVVWEADSLVRFADLLLTPESAYVQIAIADGHLRGVLRPLSS